ncbi:MAG: tetratricopeptide repeat protein [Balneolales bacterium]|nr:tetratricopeptide repeat protein [Balneolales bacterium]
MDLKFQRAVSLHQKGELTKAISLYRDILNQNPNHVDSLVNLSAIVYNQNPQDSLNLLRKARQIAPENASVHFNLGNILQRHGYREKAIREFRQVIRLQPQHAEAYLRLGNLFSESSRLEDAVFCYNKAFYLKPEDVRVVNNLTDLLNRQGKYEEAEAMAKKTLQLHPNLFEAHGNLGNVYKNQGNYEKAEFHFKEALKLNPDQSLVLYHLGATLLYSNRHKEASEHLRKSLEIDPTFYQAHSSLVYAINYIEEPTQQDIFEEHVQWGVQHSHGIKEQGWPWIERTPEKKLRVGFVSPDFKAHVVALFIQQLFKHYDKEHFEFIGYAEVEKPDNFTSTFMSLLDGWRSTIGVSDEEVYETIKGDQIDILIDLAGHTAGNRLKMMSMKPAPVQISYLGYINTTGVKEIDYRFCDAYVNPSETQNYYTEQLFPLPNSFTCYEPINPSPPVSETPALTNGYITFGCFNNTNKLSPATIKLWSELIQALPGSRLMLKSSHLNDEHTIERFKTQFLAHGVSERALIFEGSSEIYEYLQCYSKIDIGLDPFPHNGGTTSHDMLWMGVPMITMEGDRYVSRFGVSILNNLGYPEWIALNEDEYIQKAMDLASDVRLLNNIRSGLRQEMEISPLCDGIEFTSNFENALKTLWNNFCKQQIL